MSGGVFSGKIIVRGAPGGSRMVVSSAPLKIYGEVAKVGKTSLTLNMEARRHSVYNGTQRAIVSTQMVFVRIDGDGEAIPISEKVRMKYRDPKDFT